MRALPRLLRIAPSLIAVAALVAPSSAAPVWTQDAVDVAELFERSCVACHGAGSEDNRALRAWSGASDLLATAANADLITPGDAQDSNLFLSVDFDDMPPAEAGGPLGAEDKALLAAWIDAGALVPEATAPAGVAEGAESPEIEPESRTWLQAPGFRFFSRFHPAIVHFPIALLTVAFLAALLARVFSHEGLGTATTFCLTLGALSAPPAAALGWLLAANTSHRDVDTHRWLGVSVVVLSLTALWIHRRKPALLLPVLAILAALVGITGHTGGELTFGESWFEWPE